MATRCFWDTNADSYASETFMNVRKRLIDGLVDMIIYLLFNTNSSVYICRTIYFAVQQLLQCITSSLQYNRKGALLPKSSMRYH